MAPPVGPHRLQASTGRVRLIGWLRTRLLRGGQELERRVEREPGNVRCRNAVSPSESGSFHLSIRFPNQSKVESYTPALRTYTKLIVMIISRSATHLK